MIYKEIIYAANIQHKAIKLIYLSINNNNIYNNI